MLTFSTNLARVNAALATYQRTSGKTIGVVLAKQGGKFGYLLSARLRDTTPGKGTIRAERIAALARGEGVKVREGLRERLAAKYHAATEVSTRRLGLVRGAKHTFVRSVKSRGRRLNLQALAVKAELGLRERGRGFRSYGARVRGLTEALGLAGTGDTSATSPFADLLATPGTAFHRGRYGQLLAESGFKFTSTGGALEFVYGGAETELGTALDTPAGEAAIDAALGDLAADIEAYIARKLAGQMAATREEEPDA